MIESKLPAIGTTIFTRMSALASECNALNLSQGFPDFDAPEGLLEAMASGVPALSSNRSSLPEVAGDAALLIEPENVDAIAAGLERLLTDAAWRTLAASRGRQQAQRRQGRGWQAHQN